MNENVAEPSRQRNSPPRKPSSRGSNLTRVRTSHACDRCRMMRTKCSDGDRCTKCIKDNALCAYGDRKRERNRKDLVASQDRTDMLEAENTRLLNALRIVSEHPDFNPGQNVEVMELLTKYPKREEDESGTSSNSQSQPRTTTTATERMSTSRSVAQSRKTPGEKKAPSSVGSPGKQGELPHIVSLRNGGGASGFVGKMSEISWIQRAFETARGIRNDKPGNVAHGAEMDRHLATTTDFIYYMDHSDLLAVDEDYVNQYHWPPKRTVVILSEAFFHSMQGAFHFFLREEFLQQAYQFSVAQKTPSWDKRRWLAVANLVWAIGARWLQMTNMNESDLSEDHLVYFARARALGLDHRVMSDHPDVERVQGIGLLSFYLLINGSVTRAWNTLGSATRHATALGLHLRVTDESVSLLERTRRARTWYSIYSLEILFAEMTGRPKSIFLTDVTIPIDLFFSIPEESLEFAGQIDDFLSPAGSKKIWLEYLHGGRNTTQMMGGMMPWKSFQSVGRDVATSYLPQRLYLCRMSDKIATTLYSGTTEDSWTEIQRKMGSLQNELRQWAEDLPQELAIQGQEPTDTDPRTKLELAMYYHSIEMILNRPCLCEIIIDNESQRSRDFNRSSAQACVHGAISMLSLMPDYPTAHEAYQLLPWFTLLHFLAQATAVLLLELALGAPNYNDEIPQLVLGLRKAMSYLWCMTEGSFSAYRAWRIFRQLLTEVMERHGDLDIMDIPTEAPPPPGWNEDLEEITVKALQRPESEKSPFAMVS